MGRWEPNARGRLEEAALALYGERGYEQTTVAEIAKHAGLTERTFFRHFADKREVLFWGAEALREVFVRTVAEAPADATPLDAVAAALAAAAPSFEERRDNARRRHVVITANTELQERELIKLAALAGALTGALRDRGVAEPAGFNLAFAGIALSCDSGSSWSLQRLVGPARAKELLLLPRTVPADECLALGIVTRVVAADELEPTVRELATTLASGPTLAYGSIRNAVAFSSGHGLSESLEREGEYMALTGASADHKAAVAAFLAKEKPTFTGA